MVQLAAKKLSDAEQATWDRKQPCNCNQRVHCVRFHGAQEYPPLAVMSDEEYVGVFKSIWEKIYPTTYEKHVDDLVMRNGVCINGVVAAA